MPHEAIEKMSRMMSTAFTTGLAERIREYMSPAATRLSGAPPSSCRARKNHPGVGNKASESIHIGESRCG